ERRARRFGCESAAPKFPPNRPSKFVLRPSFGAMKSDAAHEAMGREQLDAPHAIAARMPMPDDRGHVVPRVGARHLFARRETGDFEIRVDRGVFLKVARLEHTERQARCSEDWRSKHVCFRRKPVSISGALRVTASGMFAVTQQCPL